MSKYDRLLGPRWGGCAVGPHEQSRVALLLLGGAYLLRYFLGLVLVIF
jgi:hypothetical protein